MVIRAPGPVMLSTWSRVDRQTCAIAHDIASRAAGGVQIEATTAILTQGRNPNHGVAVHRTMQPRRGYGYAGLLAWEWTNGLALCAGGCGLTEICGAAAGFAK
jgi:hypothetical protein